MLALYLHIPFCLSKCRYCAFNSQPLPSGTAGAVLIRGYLDALHREMQLAAQNQTSGVRRQASEKEGIGEARPPQWAPANKNPTTDDRRPTTERESLHSIYFGGGTPTILDPSCLCSILEQSKHYFKWDKSIEITVEANPATVTRDGLEELRRAGVNRLSLGVQSFSSPDLRLLGRIHGASDIYTACRDARAAGFANLSLDLIYGLPGQTAGAWRENLQRALDLHPEHLSVYGLKLEPGTPLAEDVTAGRLRECGEDEQLAMWSETQRLVLAAGFEHYEISNYARPGYQSRHNLTYWLNQPYLSLGAGASGYLRSDARRQTSEITQESGIRSEESGGKDLKASRKGIQISNPTSNIRRRTSDVRYLRYANHEDVQVYIATIDRGELPRAWEEHQSPEQERADTVMMGLRLTGGLDRRAFQARFGHSFEFFYGEQLAIMERDGLMGESEAAVYLTERGLLLSNYVLAPFI
jgi:oxygen-independent coproporphyrinogen-3 oxidase